MYIFVFIVEPVRNMFIWSYNRRIKVDVGIMHILGAHGSIDRGLFHSQSDMMVVSNVSGKNEHDTSRCAFSVYLQMIVQ